MRQFLSFVALAIFLSETAGFPSFMGVQRPRYVSQINPNKMQMRSRSAGILPMINANEMISFPPRRAIRPSSLPQRKRRRYPSREDPSDSARFLGWFGNKQVEPESAYHPSQIRPPLFPGATMSNVNQFPMNMNPAILGPGTGTFHDHGPDIFEECEEIFSHYTGTWQEVCYECEEVFNEHTRNWEEFCYPMDYR